MKSSADFYREYPEMLSEEEAEPQRTNAIGFEFYPPEEDYYGLEEDKKLKI